MALVNIIIGSFLKNVAESHFTSKGTSITINKFAQKYRFIGSWDVTGKLIKSAIKNVELGEKRVATALIVMIN